MFSNISEFDILRTTKKRIDNSTKEIIHVTRIYSSWNVTEQLLWVNNLITNKSVAILEPPRRILNTLCVNICSCKHEKIISSQCCGTIWQQLAKEKYILGSLQGTTTGQLFCLWVETRWLHCNTINELSTITDPTSKWITGKLEFMLQYPTTCTSCLEVEERCDNHNGEI